MYKVDSMQKGMSNTRRRVKLKSNAQWQVNHRNEESICLVYRSNVAMIAERISELDTL